ncbi:hypothetical protein ACJX0J_031900, partial [Zea mays]
VLVSLQGALTVIGNITMCIAACRIFKASQEGSKNFIGCKIGSYNRSGKGCYATPHLKVDIAASLRRCRERSSVGMKPPLGEDMDQMSGRGTWAG